MGRVEFRISVDIAAPPDRVWSVMTDVERWHEWTPSIRRIRRLDDGELRVGSRARIRQPWLPPAVWTVSAIEPVRSFTWQSTAPGLLVHAEHSVAPIKGGTRATLVLRYDGALGRFLARLTRGLTNRHLGFEAAGLKRRSEEIARVR